MLYQPYGYCELCCLFFFASELCNCHMYSLYILNKDCFQLTSTYVSMGIFTQRDDLWTSQQNHHKGEACRL